MRTIEGSVYLFPRDEPRQAGQKYWLNWAGFTLECFGFIPLGRRTPVLFSFYLKSVTLLEEITKRARQRIDHCRIFCTLPVLVPLLVSAAARTKRERGIRASGGV